VVVKVTGGAGEHRLKAANAESQLEDLKSEPAPKVLAANFLGSFRAKCGKNFRRSCVIAVASVGKTTSRLTPLRSRREPGETRWNAGASRCPLGAHVSAGPQLEQLPGAGDLASISSSGAPGAALLLWQPRSFAPVDVPPPVSIYIIILLTSERVWGWEGSGLWFAIEASRLDSSLDCVRRIMVFPDGE
jgi:hypothetical protein